MKCPNCNKEAIFVNGKYVCLDCGIEITPEQEAAQNAAEPSVFSSTAPTPEPAPSSGTPVSDSASAPVATPEPVISEAAAPEEPVEKPVQTYYEEALSSDTTPAAPASGSGIYDFSDDQKEPESSVETTGQEVPVSDMAASESGQPEPPAEPQTVEAPVVSDTSSATPESYFAPSSFDINKPQESNSEEQVVAPENPVEIPVQAVPEPASVDSSGAPEARIPTPEPVSATGQEEPLTVTPDEVFGNAPAAEPVAPVKTLDEMLDQSEVQVPMEQSPVSAYGAPTPEITTANVSQESALPSVESVFGNQSATQSPSNPKIPTAQDFGVAPKPKPQKNNKWILPVAIGAGALLLIVGVALALIFTSNKKPATKYPVNLEQEAINSLSSSVTNAMEPDQGVEADYSLDVDFSELEVTENATEKEAIEAQIKTPYNLSGKWYTDKDGDINTDTAVGEKTDRRTYIKESSKTYVYSEATQKYEPVDGLALINVPAVFEPEEKASILYATNIKKIVLAGKDNLDGAEYSRYEVVLNEDLVSETLEVLGGIFKDATYTSLNTNNLVFNVWVSDDHKIKKITVNGVVAVESEKVSGNIKISGEAVYRYLEITIDNPTGPPATTENTGTPVPATSTREEEGQTSSLDSGAAVLEEARG